MKLSIIIPVYNEEKNIILVLNKLKSVKLQENIEKEIIIVNDCSDDGSENAILNYKKSDPDFNFEYFKHQTNKGKGAAVKTGINYSHGDIILIQDADLELNPYDIPSMLSVMFELKVEFVNGSRFLAGVNRPLSSYKRYLINRIFTFLTSVIINVKITDMACGYKLFTRSIYDKIILKENKFGFEAELIIKALRLKRNNIAEVPVQYFPRNNGEGKKLRNIDGLKVFWTIIKFGLFKLK